VPEDLILIDEREESWVNQSTAFRAKLIFAGELVINCSLAKSASVTTTTREVKLSASVFDTAAAKRYSAPPESGRENCWLGRIAKDSAWALANSVVVNNFVSPPSLIFSLSI